MPEFQQDDNPPYRSIKIHFKNMDDIIAFSKLVGQKISDATKYLWFPEGSRMNLKSSEYVDGE